MLERRSNVCLIPCRQFKLESLCAELDIKINKSHRALEDAKNAGLLFLYILDKMEMLDLQEGQEIGAFSKEEITQNSLFSQKWKQHYPISPISAKVFQHFMGEYVHD